MGVADMVSRCSRDSTRFAGRVEEERLPEPANNERRLAPSVTRWERMKSLRGTGVPPKQGIGDANGIGGELPHGAGACERPKGEYLLAAPVWRGHEGVDRRQRGRPAARHSLRTLAHRGTSGPTETMRAVQITTPG